MSKNILTLFLPGVLCLLFGCASTEKVSLNKQEIARAYLTKINKKDGINRREAVLLAQNELLFLGRDHEYNINGPKIVSETPRLWIIHFPSLPKTFQEVLSKPELNILVEKKDGSVRAKEIYRHD